MDLYLVPVLVLLLHLDLLLRVLLVQLEQQMEGMHVMDLWALSLDLLMLAVLLPQNKLLLLVLLMMVILMVVDRLLLLLVLVLLLNRIVFCTIY